MKTKHLDNEIERLNLMERTKDLSEYGQDMLNEFRAIKQALTIPVVSKPKGTVCKHKGCKHRHVNEFDGYCLKHYSQPAN